MLAAHYRSDYEAIFGMMPPLSTGDAATAVFVNMGKAIAAYERTIDYTPSRFDRYADALQDTGRAPEGVLSADEVAGLRLFIGKASCANCHNGPLLTNNEFHNTGVPARPAVRTPGRWRPTRSRRRRHGSRGAWRLLLRRSCFTRACVRTTICVSVPRDACCRTVEPSHCGEC